MTIDKAIEILAKRSESPFVKANQDTLHAMKLGIEALRRVKLVRDSPSGYYEYRLPGETER